MGVRILIGIFELVFHSVRSVFTFVLVVLAAVVVIAATVLLGPTSLSVAAAVGAAISAGLAGGHISAKLERSRHQ